MGYRNESAVIAEAIDSARNTQEHDLSASAAPGVADDLEAELQQSTSSGLFLAFDASEQEQTGDVLCLDIDGYDTYVVTKGDSLSKIVRQEFGDLKRLDEVIKLNQELTPGFDADKLKIDQVIFLPRDTAGGVSAVTVKAGDTLSQLTLEQLGTTDLKEVIALNKKLDSRFDKDRLSIGQKVFFPAKEAPQNDREPRIKPRELEPAPPAPTKKPAPSFKPRVYTVRPGDTISEIAERELGSAGRLREIIRLNNASGSFDADRIRVGQEILLPSGSVQSQNAPIKGGKLSFDLTQAQRLLQLHEGYRSKTYLCTAGKCTIGIGHNLEAAGNSADYERYVTNGERASAEQITRWFRTDMTKTIAGLNRRYGENPAYHKLNDARRLVLLDMSFNLGDAGLKKFRQVHAAIERGDYNAAADEMLDSKWASQVKGRALRLANMMRTGRFPSDVP